jgi:predicted HAD superfamily Cof-like phosphohydrolase
MSNWYQDVKNFHYAFGQRVGEKPELPSAIQERELRKKLLQEEFDEYIQAENEESIVDVADALADIIYIACGTAVAYGIPLDKIFNEVHRSNMAKLVNGQPIYRADGKVLKPEGWTAPDVKGILEKESEDVQRRKDLQTAIITL